MSDDMLLHLSSNSSNQSDQSLPSKIARLEARMISKGSSGPTVSTPAPANWPSVSSVANFRPVVIPTPVEDQADPLLSSDSDDDDDVSLISVYSPVLLIIVAFILLHMFGKQCPMILGLVWFFYI